MYELELSFYHYHTLTLSIVATVVDSFSHVLKEKM